MPIIIQEPISAIVSFTTNRIQPISFGWRGRQIRIDSVPFIWKTDAGRARLIHFSVTSSRTLYELIFNNQTLNWKLERLEVQ